MRVCCRSAAPAGQSRSGIAYYRVASERRALFERRRDPRPYRRLARARLATRLEDIGDLQSNTDRGALFLRRPGTIKDISVVLVSRVDSRRTCVDIQKEFAHQTLFGGCVGCIKR